MNNTLDYASPAKGSANKRIFGWVVCGVIIIVSLLIGFGSLRFAAEYRQMMAAPRGSGPADPYGIIFGRMLHGYGSPIILCLAAVGCAFCWQRKTGPWLAIAGWVVGIVCWVRGLYVYM